MSTVTSSDGTTIAYSKTGSGPALILVDGALCHREFGPAKSFADALSDTFTVYTYDRRGRGQSADSQPYDVQREVEDLAALVKEAGGSAYVFGQSSGGALALEAAKAGVPITKVAAYEIPFSITPGSKTEPEGYGQTLTSALAEGNNGKAVKAFMKMVGMPGPMLAVFPLLPPWRKLKAVAPTLPYDRACIAPHVHGEPLPGDRYAGVSAPALVMAGGKSDEWFRAGMQQVRDRLGDAEYKTIDGQNHMLKAAAMAPVLKAFFQ